MYSLPQIEVPVLEIMSYDIVQYKFSCSTGGTLRLVSLSLAWRFLESGKKSSTGYALRPVTLSGKRNGRHVIKASSKLASFTVTQPSTLLNGVYYCEWKTSSTIQRSPAFEIRVNLGNTYIMYVCLSVMIIYFLDRTNAHFCNKLKRQQLN